MVVCEAGNKCRSSLCHHMCIKLHCILILFCHFYETAMVHCLEHLTHNSTVISLSAAWNEGYFAKNKISFILFFLVKNRGTPAPVNDLHDCYSHNNWDCLLNRMSLMSECAVTWYLAMLMLFVFEGYVALVLHKIQILGCVKIALTIMKSLVFAEERYHKKCRRFARKAKHLFQ